MMYDGGLYRMARLEGDKSLPSQQRGSRRLVYLPPTNIGQSRGWVWCQIPAECPRYLHFRYVELHFGTYRCGNTKIPLQPTNTSAAPFKCLVWIINCLIMWGGWVVGGGLRGGLYRLELLEGEKSLPPQQLGGRFIVYLFQTNIDQSRGGIRSTVFVFPIRRFSFLVLIGGEMQRSLYNPRIHRPAKLNV